METKFVFNRKNKLQNGKGKIELIIYLSRTKRPIKSTGIQIEPKYWNDKTCRIKTSHPSCDFLNSQLELLKINIERNLLAQKINTGKIDINKLKETKEQTFYNYFEFEVMAMANAELSKGTHLIYKRTLKYLKEFSKDIEINKISVSWLDNFNSFLINEKKLAINTRVTLFRKINKVFNYAIANDLLLASENPFNKGFSIREVEPSKKSLTLQELKKIESLDMTLRPELERTKDMFLLACYTAMRFGDLVELSFENFEIVGQENIRLKYTPQKTKKINNKSIQWIISHFWNGKADKIVRKYFDKYEERRNAPISTRYFFKISNQKYNQALKELQRFAEIDTVLTSHLARHTCITLLVNDFRLDITKAQLIAGHSRIEMTMKYLKITENDLSEAGKRINW